MNLDLRTILDGWEYEAGKISVRKIIGREGREKIQTRVDLGVLQFEVDGRPDGKRPHGCESLLDYWEQLHREHVIAHGDDDEFTVSPDDCRELRQEGHLYYQRYLSMFVLEEFDKVERDTARNLRLIDFCHDYAEAVEDAQALESHRAYVLMMNARARAYGALGRSDFDAALQSVRGGIRQLQELADGDGLGVGEPTPGEPELRVLRKLQDEIYAKMPANARARLERELEHAVDREDYESAARLRDQLAGLANE